MHKHISHQKSTPQKSSRISSGIFQMPATWKHGWSKHGSSIIPSNHSMPQDLHSPCLNWTNSARTMFTPTMFPRRRKWMSRGTFQRILICQRYFPKDRHLFQWISLDRSNGHSLELSNGLSLLWFLVCNIMPRPWRRPFLSGVGGGRELRLCVPDALSHVYCVLYYIIIYYTT